jgi:hypothetical protein
LLYIYIDYSPYVSVCQERRKKEEMQQIKDMKAAACSSASQG